MIRTRDEMGGMPSAASYLVEAAANELAAESAATLTAMNASGRRHSPPPPPSNQQQRRSQQLVQRYDSLKEQFFTDRTKEHSKQREALQRQLDSLLRGDEAGFVEDVADLDEIRDLELVRLAVYEEYLMGRAQAEHDDRMATIESHFTTSTRDMQEKLVQRLELQADQSKAPFADISVALDVVSSRPHTPRGTAVSSALNGNTPGQASDALLSGRDSSTGAFAAVLGHGHGGFSRGTRSRRTRDDGSDMNGLSNGRGGADDDLKFFMSEMDFDYSSGYVSGGPATAAAPPIQLTGAPGRPSKQPKLLALKQEEIDYDLAALRKDSMRLGIIRRRLE